MAEELTALHQTHTWDLVPLPPRKLPIGSRGVYKIKTKWDCSVERYKARLVATFALVARMSTIHTLIVVTSIFQWKIFQMDMKNSFLNGDLHEEVYMIPPRNVSHKSGEVCKHQKALYGFKQAPRAWFQKFSIVIVSLSFVTSNHDFALFVKKTDADAFFILMLMIWLLLVMILMELHL